MNLRGIANSIITAVNPNISAVLKVNDGYDVNDCGDQVPKYSEHKIIIQTQSLETKDLEHLNLVNQQGQFIYAYANGCISALRRALGKGSEQLIFKPYGEDDDVVWNVTKVIESYPTWVKVLLWRQ
ncbi:hypothetical protein BFG52_08135 [Acinetobacter larvae]|uniref:Uncharacterized protein n=1 Tax=Acinetobacter larvae TaxID=1789224 RepID=A0A1B2M3Y6_9GAMM|nr:hypothetical protein BFG52_08135 [Acinetobacter larvae]